MEAGYRIKILHILLSTQNINKRQINNIVKLKLFETLYFVEFWAYEERWFIERYYSKLTDENLINILRGSKTIHIEIFEEYIKMLYSRLKQNDELFNTLCFMIRRNTLDYNLTHILLILINNQLSTEYIRKRVINLDGNDIRYKESMNKINNNKS